IYECHVLTGRLLTDRHVQAALERLVVGLRAGGLPPLEEGTTVHYTRGREVDLLVDHIRRSWRELFATYPNPGLDNQVGVLRTLLSSVDTWGTRSPDSRGYLNFVEGFLRKTGVRAELVSAEGEVDEEPDDPLLEAGEDWLAGDRGARAEFFGMAED